ncbi:hypothetical protein F4693_002319 [Sphingomonas endophytica]|uniref:Uncharacterized protein n=1 Tax=Sphingomonas endophytica TaxID=869719 RepID=A0A7X0JF11_9SPHN|nr:hypothetical protein [Sphingomonas endophytica]MBB6505331.1 hypothetical protein [Sphingomonas endophytica]
MKAEVTESDGVILIDVQQPGACALALEVNEAIDLAQQLLRAVVEASKIAPFDPRFIRS